MEVDSSTGENVKEAFVMCTKALLDKNDPGFPPSPKPRGNLISGQRCKLLHQSHEPKFHCEI